MQTQVNYAPQMFVYLPVSLVCLAQHIEVSFLVGSEELWVEHCLQVGDRRAVGMRRSALGLLRAVGI